VHILTSQFGLAEHYLNEAEVLIDQGVPYNLELIKIYKALYTLYEDSNDFQKVAQYQQKYIQLKDSIYNEELTRNLMRVEGEYLERENTAKIEAQNEILTLNEAIIFRQRLVTIFVGIAAVLLVALTIVLYKHNQRRRLANQLLEIRVRERTRELEQNRDSLQHTLDERSVVFRKISMEFRAALATVKGLCSLGLADEESENQRQYLRKINHTSEELLRTLTNTMSNSRYSRIEH
jgi:C4-dicarboxylate-specific signal transduction histidine kinase